MKKRIPALLLTLALLCTLLPQITLFSHAETNSGVCGDNLTWAFDEASGKLIISGTGDMYDYTFNNLPWLGLMEEITAVSFPEGMTSISNIAFAGCTGLKTAVIPDTVTHVGISAFYGCSSLESVTLSQNLTEIPYMCFAQCSALKQLTVPDSVTEIAEHACYGCTSLEKLTLGNGVRTIGCWAFDSAADTPENNTRLTELVIPAQVERIERHAFVGYSNLKTVVVYAKDAVFEENALGYCYDLSEQAQPQNSYRGGVIEVLKTVDGLTIMGYADATAEVYAKENEIPFVPFGKTLFADVKSGAYYEDAVAWAVENGVTNGTGAYSFSPDNTCTRSQIVTFLWRAAGSPEPVAADTPFLDVQTGTFYEKAVRWAVENQITTGTGPSTFSPSATCTRGQVVTFLWRAAGSQNPTSAANPFADVPGNAYYSKAVLWAVENNVTKGTGATTFSPEAGCTRGQVVTFLWRAADES